MLPCAIIMTCAALLVSFAGPVRAAAPRDEQTVPLTIADGDEHDPGRTFFVPVECEGQKAAFLLGCNGPSRLSESFARKCRAAVLPDEQLAKLTDPDGKPTFAGSAQVRLVFGGRVHDVRAGVMKDAYCQKSEKEGILGGDVLRAFQWEVDPAIPSLTLRPPGTPPKSKPLAILPLKLSGDVYSIRVRVRNVSEEVALMPGSSFIQAGTRLQRRWDLNSGKKFVPEVKTFGNVRVTELRGEDAVELTSQVRETDLPVALLSAALNADGQPAADSGIGQCLLNRFVYCVDPKRQQFRLMRRRAE